jgi:hypothetical protein
MWGPLSPVGHRPVVVVLQDMREGLQTAAAALLYSDWLAPTQRALCWYEEATGTRFLHSAAVLEKFYVC